MRKNSWKDLRRIKIRPTDIILAVLIILAFVMFCGVNAGDAEAGQQEQEQETEVHEDIREAEPPIAGATKAIYLSFEKMEATAEESDTAEVESGYDPDEPFYIPDGFEDWMEHYGRTETETDGAAGEAEPEFFIEDLPLTQQEQEWFWYYSGLYGCRPVSFPLGTADVETGFTQSAIGEAGEKGQMQILPGAGGKHFKAIEDVTGLDPATPEGNIAAGCYLLGKYLEMTGGDFEMASMAYNFGLGRAQELWEQGIYSSEYSRKVYEAYQKWDAVIKDAGIE